MLYVGKATPKIIFKFTSNPLIIIEQTTSNHRFVLSLFISLGWWIRSVSRSISLVSCLAYQTQNKAVGMLGQTASSLSLFLDEIIGFYVPNPLQFHAVIIGIIAKNKWPGWPEWSDQASLDAGILASENQIFRFTGKISGYILTTMSSLQGHFTKNCTHGVLVRRNHPSCVPIFINFSAI